MTAISMVSIVNLALTKLGEDRFVTNLTSDGTKQSIIFNSNYEVLRDALLRQHLWNFAKRRVVLSSEVATPAFGGGSYFVLPPDCLKVISINEDPYADHEIEDNRIVWSGNALNLRYITRVEDPATFDPMFIEAYSSYMAYKNAYAITKNMTSQEAMLVQYKQDLITAKHCNAIDNGIMRFTSDSFSNERE
jgi:hypothetical protein